MSWLNRCSGAGLAPFDTRLNKTQVCIHALIILLILILIILGLYNLFLFHQILPIKRARSIQSQPRSYTIQIKAMRLMTWQLYYQAILIVLPNLS